MSFTTKALINLGLTEEQAKEVLALRGKDLNEDKAALDTITKERDSLKDQLQNANTQLETLKAAETTSAETKQALEQLQADYNKYKEEAEGKLAQTQKVNAITLALRDTKAHNPDTLLKFIDVDAIELDDNGKPKLDDVINGLKESDPYLFQAEEDSTPNPNIVPPGNPAASGAGKPDPFQAIIDGYK